VIIAIVIQALWALGKTAVKDSLTAFVGAAVMLLFFFGVNEILLLFAGGLAVMALKNLWRGWKSRKLLSLAFPSLSILAAAMPTTTPAVVATTPVSLVKLTLFFLKVGSVLFGSGYALLAFLRADLVGRWHWLSGEQLLDAIAIGQFTPGPVLTTATFIGYLIAGSPGALLASVGIFLPGFLFVWASHPLIPRLRSSPWTAGFLDGVNVASLGLMATVTVQLARAALVDWLTIALALVSTVAVFRFKINSAWLVLGGGIAGLVAKLLT
jgi:chromate transporter